jgi:hypothetical protein
MVTPVVAMYLLAGGNLSSVHLPARSMPRGRTGRVGGRSQAIMLLTYPMAYCVLLAYGLDMRSVARRHT